MKDQLRALRLVVSAMVLCFAFAGAVSAQETTGSIVGSVKDSAGAAVAGATVTATIPSQDNKVIRTVTTTDDGTFSIPNIPTNVFSITVEAPGFQEDCANGR